jgi:hypothetical protein
VTHSSREHVGAERLVCRCCALGPAVKNAKLHASHVFAAMDALYTCCGMRPKDSSLGDKSGVAIGLLSWFLPTFDLALTDTFGRRSARRLQIDQC